ncbi:flavoprotein [Mollicutes bacterium LVI A0078]|nr:flavoprotein [Mollicutes bacterium LVI A0075]WOO91470.1 flavoprotein [Mollicutes bacterium LVI A0078]
MKKKLLVGVSGSIAAHKTTRLVEELAKDYDVKVVLTKSASKFVSELSLELLSKHKVHVDVFDSYDDRVTHVEDAKEADLVLIVPASANTIGKIANGIADNMLTASVMVAKPNKVVLCPAMNDNMYTNKRVQANLQILKEDGMHIIDPIECTLTSGDIGIGGLAEDKTILEYVKNNI